MRKRDTSQQLHKKKAGSSPAGVKSKKRSSKPKKGSAEPKKLSEKPKTKSVRRKAGDDKVVSFSKKGAKKKSAEKALRPEWKEKPLRPEWKEKPLSPEKTEASEQPKEHLVAWKTDPKVLRKREKELARSRKAEKRRGGRIGETKQDENSRGKIGRGDSGRSLFNRGDSGRSLFNRGENGRGRAVRGGHLGRRIVLLAILFLGLSLWGTWYYIDQTYTITTVYVEGNSHYTDEQIIDKVMSGSLGHNSLYLDFKYRNKQIDDIPFVSAIEVEIITADTVRITVYEKSLAGYVSYLGRYMYFDKEGTVVECSTQRTNGVPQVLGLDFDHVIMLEPLPVENREVFTQILDVTQSLNKYELEADRIFFDKSYQVTLYFDKVRVLIGGRDHIDEKFSRLHDILPNLSGKTGELNLADYSSNSTMVSFKSDTPLREEPAPETGEETGGETN